jgi:hypothetical protein
MTGTHLADDLQAGAPAGDCPHCGQPFTQLIDGRCPSCGERVANADVTSDDNTPYAQALAEGRHGWRGMCRWVYTANKKRLTHLGLMRASRYSRRFGRVNLILLALCVGFAVFANLGWHQVVPAPGLLAASPAPEGKGWLKAFDTIDVDGPEKAVALWWNLPWATVAGVAAFLIAWIVGQVLIGIVGRGAQRSLGSGAAHRLRCAVHYSTAWALLLSAAALTLALVPLGQVLEVLGWARLPELVYRVPAVLLAVTGALVWYLWLVRLAQTTPPEGRPPAVRYMLLRVPVIVLVIVGGTVYGCWVGADGLMRQLGLHW